MRRGRSVGQRSPFHRPESSPVEQPIYMQVVCALLLLLLLLLFAQENEYNKYLENPQLLKL